MSSEIELKPCPFCGEPGELREYVRGFFAAGCPDPDCIGTRENISGEPSPVEAAARWNTRTPPSSATPGDGVFWAYFKPPFRFVEVGDTYYVEDSNATCRMRVMLMWPTHPPEETEAAEIETRRLGEVFAAAANEAHRNATAAIIGTQPQERAGSDAGALKWAEDQKCQCGAFPGKACPVSPCNLSIATKPAGTLVVRKAGDFDVVDIHDVPDDLPVGEHKLFIAATRPQPASDAVAYTKGDEVILAKFWRADAPPEGWTPLFSKVGE